MHSAAAVHQKRGVMTFLRARRARTLVLIALALTVAGLAIGALAWIYNYQPLSHGGGYGLPGEAKELPGIDGTSIWIRPGKRFYFELSVENTGPFTVRIVGVPLDMATLPFHGRVRMTGPVYHRGINYPKPFHLSTCDRVRAFS